jgi:hypothetical protein
MDMRTSLVVLGELVAIVWMASFIAWRGTAAPPIVAQPTPSMVKSSLVGVHSTP